MKTILGAVLIILTIIVESNAQSLKINALVTNEITDETSILLVNKTEGDIQLFTPKRGYINAELDLGYEYDLIFMSEHCATKVLQFDLKINEFTQVTGGRFNFEVIMIPAKEPEEVIVAGIVTYVEDSKQLSYRVVR